MQSWHHCYCYWYHQAPRQWISRVSSSLHTARLFTDTLYAVPSCFPAGEFPVLHSSCDNKANYWLGFAVLHQRPNFLAVNSFVSCVTPFTVFLPLSYLQPLHTTVLRPWCINVRCPYIQSVYEHSATWLPKDHCPLATWRYQDVTSSIHSRIHERTVIKTSSIIVPQNSIRNLSRVHAYNNTQWDGHTEGEEKQSEIVPSTDQKADEYSQCPT